MKIIKWFAFCFAFCLFLFALTGAYLQSMGRRSHADAQRVIAVWGDRIFRWACVVMRIRVEMDVPINRTHGPPLIVANHTSFFDFLAVLSLANRLRLPVCWVVKREVLDYPVIGTLARRQGCIPVYRDGRIDDRKGVDQGAQQAHKEGSSLLIFAEGTRLPELGTPKPGGFIRAQETYGHVLSVTIAWYKPLSKDASGKYVVDGADLFGRDLLIHARHVSRTTAKLEGFLDAEWSRKKAIIRDWRQVRVAHHLGWGRSMQR